MKTIRLNSTCVDLDFSIHNYASPGERLEISPLPAIRFARISKMFYYLTISFLTVNIYITCIVITKKYRHLFGRANG